MFEVHKPTTELESENTQTHEVLSRPPQAVIFDMDGLLLDSEIIYGRVWEQAASELGYASNLNDYLQYVGRRAEDCNEGLRATYGDNFPLTRFWERQIELYDEHRNKWGIHVKPGVGELLTYLQGCRIVTAIATSTHREEALSSLGELSRRFDVIVTGDEVRNGKPNPEIFILAAQRLGVPLSACLVLEDAEAGVRAAISASIPVIMVPDLKPCPETLMQKVTAICTSLHEVKTLLYRVIEASADHGK